MASHVHWLIMQKLLHTLVADIQAQTGAVTDDCASMCNANRSDIATSVDVLHEIMPIKPFFALADIACMTATSWY